MTFICSTKSLLKEYWDLQVPIDPEYFAEKLGLTVVQEPLGYRSGYLDAAGKTIHVNSTESRVRQHFTVAHELGHYCLGHSSAEPNNMAINFGKDYDPAKEAAANRFAAELIMPAIAIRALIKSRGITDPVELRKALGVSSVALNLRLTALGYFL